MIYIIPGDIMNFKTTVKRLYKANSLITIISTLLLILSLVMSFDEINGYFEGGIFPVLFWISFVLGIALSVASVLLMPQKEIIKTDVSLGKAKNTYIALAAILAIEAIVFNLFSTSKYFTIAIAGICFFVLFIALCVASGYKYSHIKILALLLSALFPVLINMENGLVMNRHSNSVENLLTSIFAISFLMYLLYEGKLLFTGEHSKWHFASMLLASHTGLTLSVSYFMAYGFAAVDERSRLYQITLILIISLFIKTELVRFTTQAESHTKEEWDGIEAPEQETTEEETAQ